MKKTIGVVAVLAGLSLSTSAFAAFDHLEFAKKEIMPCAHPVSTLTSASYNQIGGKEVNVINGVKVARVELLYKGKIIDKPNALVIDVKYDDSKTPALVQVKVVSDSALTGTKKCKYISDSWQEYTAK